MTFEGFPFIVGWELTLKCNIRCLHCGSSAGMPRENELSLKESLAICEQLPDLLVQEVNFTGGEPLLCPYWVEITRCLKDLGINSKILTNGLTLNGENINKLKEVEIAGVGISLDGLDSTHDYIRGRKGLFQQVMNGIARTLQKDIPLTIITAVNALNIDELPHLFNLLVSLGVDRWQIQPIFPLGRVNIASELQLTQEHYMQLGNFVKNWGPRAEENGLKLLPADSYGYYTEFDNREKPWRGCPAGIVSVGITSNGKIKGCLSLPDEIVEGDLRKNDLWNIWFHPDSFSYTRQFSEDLLGSNCISCDNRKECRGGCSAMSYGSTGIFHNDIYCFYGIRQRAR